MKKFLYRRYFFRNVPLSVPTVLFKQSIGTDIVVNFKVPSAQLCKIPALGVSVKSVHLVAGRLGFYSQSDHIKDFKNSIRSFRARRSAQAEVRRVLCMCCSSCYVL